MSALSIELEHLRTARDHALMRMRETEDNGWSTFTAAVWSGEAHTLDRFISTPSILTEGTPHA